MSNQSELSVIHSFLLRTNAIGIPTVLKFKVWNLQLNDIKVTIFWHDLPLTDVRILCGNIGFHTRQSTRVISENSAATEGGITWKY